MTMSNHTLLQRFKKQVEKLGEKTALIEPEGRKISYSELNEYAGRIAEKMRLSDVKQNDTVAIVLPNGIDVVAAMLASLKLGAAFAALNGRYPEDRLQYIYKDCSAALVVTPDFFADAGSYKPMEEEAVVSDEDTAMLVYTSGSTGNPKGVVIDQLAISSSIRSIVSEEDVFGLGAPFFFIAGSKILFNGLVNGCTNVIIPQTIMRDPQLLAELIAEYQITSSFISPKVLRYFKPIGNSLKKVTTGSERLSGIWSDEFKIYNTYGMSETVAGVLQFEVDRPYENTPVGKPFKGTEVYLLDENGQEAEEGEICVAGHLGKEYLNLPEESARVFVPNPFKDRDGFDRMIHTGDIGKRLPDGNIVYLNRKDWMVKINGQRVEPGEIEAKLRRIEEISDAAVKDFTDASGQTFLVAYYVLKKELEEPVIRETLKGMLPDYMLPSFFVRLDRLPVNANGKLDRGALKNPDIGEKRTVYAAPENELQEKIVKAYEKVLDLSGIGIDDDFFSLGGDSIKVIMLQRLLKEMDVTVAASEVFEAHTPRALSASKGQKSSLSGYKGHEADAYPLTRAQMSIYLDSLMPGKETAYNNTFGLFLPDGMDAPRLIHAAETVLNHYPVFLSAARIVDDQPSLVPLKNVKITVAQVETDERDKDILAQSVNTPFELEAGPLCRAAVFHTPEGLFFVCTAHHLVSDGTSLSIVARNIAAVYNGNAIADEDMSNFTLALYESEHKNEMKADEDIYRRMMDEMDGDTALYADDDPALADFAGVLGTFHMTLYARKKELAGTLLPTLAQNGVTESSLFMTAYAYMLGLMCGQKDVLFFAGENGRHDPVLMNTVGMLVHNVPVFVKLDDKKNGLAFTKQVQELFHELVSHDNADYAALLGEYSVRPDNFFVYQGEMFTDISMDGRNIPMELYASRDVMASLTLHVIKQSDGDYALCFDYAAEKYKSDTIRRMAELYIQIVDGLCGGGRLSDIRLTTDEDILKMDGFNDTQADYPVTDIVSMFRTSVERYPDREAVIFKDKVFTYSGLDEASERIAGYLSGQGIGRGNVVSILIPRCEYMPIAALGVLKTGAAYHPLDPGYPTERLTLMMEDAGCSLLIAEEDLLEKVPDYTGPVLLMKDIPSLPACEAIKDHPAPEDLFILLYTSGSTGVPKGVMLEHHSLANFCRWYQDYFQLDETGRVAAYASFGFDACMMDMYTALTTGACTCIVEEEIRLDLKAMEEWFNRVGITHSFMTTQVGRQFYAIANVPTLRCLSTGGEKLAGVELRPEITTKLYNVYGPTECTIFTTAFPMEKHYARIPIGKPLTNYKCYVADENMRRLPPMVPGELLIAGRGVGRGYLNKPELTEKAFAVNPFSDDPEYARVYHTGDVVRLLPDGSYDFVGRNDGQVKIRGFRIELTEIEVVIREFPGIKDVTVQAFDSEGSEGKFIAAYIVSDNEIDINALNEFIAARKPYYMVPAVTMQIESIPLNQNQKVNKKALPKPVRKAMEIVKPANDMERTLFDICAKIVGYDEFGVTVPFEEIGFTSLSYIELASKVISTVGVELKLSDLMAGGTTIRSLSELISKADMVEKSHKEHKDRYPLAPQQYALMYHSVASDMYREFVFIEKWSDALAVRKAFVNIINSFPYLYTTFRQEDGEWYQIPYDGQMLTEEDIPVYDRAPSESDIEKFCTPYEISETERLFDVCIYSGEKVIVLLHIHHVLMDHVFMEKLVSYISESLRNPAFRPSEQADYFEYALENAVEKSPVEGKEPHKVETTKTVYDVVYLNDMKPVMEKYKIQPAEYMFGLLSQAYLDVLGLDEAVIHNVFGGRNEARYFDTAGYFPIGVPIHVEKDSDAFSRVKQDIVESLAGSAPKDDYGYNALVNHNYVWPVVTYNCMDYISMTKDFELITLQSKNTPISEEVKVTNAHIHLLCFVYPEKGVLMNIIFDPSTIDEDQAKAILERAKEISKSC